MEHEDEAHRHESIVTDPEILDLSRAMLRKVIREFPADIKARIKGLADTFAIDDRYYTIYVPSSDALRGIDPESIDTVFSGGLRHELGHPSLFPGSSILALSIAKKYSESRRIDFDRGLYSALSNIVSDIMLEVALCSMKIPSYRHIPAMRAIFVARTLNPESIYYSSGDVVESLFRTHNRVFVALNNGAIGGLDPKSISVIIDRDTIQYNIYSAISSAAGGFKLSDAAEIMNNKAALRDIASELIYRYRIFDKADGMYRMLDKGSIDASSLSSLFSASTPALSAYAAYYISTLALYRFCVDRGCSIASNPCGFKLPDNVPDDVLDSAFPDENDIYGYGYGGSGYIGTIDLLEPRTAESIARMLSLDILVGRSRRPASRRARITDKRPFRGRIIDPVSFSMHSHLSFPARIAASRERWRRAATIRSASEDSSSADTATIILDASGSTLYATDILFTLLGRETPVFDVERVIAMSALQTVNRSREIDANLILFSDHAVVRGGSSVEIYNELKNMRVTDYEVWGGTNIVDAVDSGLKSHRDSYDSILVLMTDMQIDREQAEQVYSRLSRLRKTPALVIVVSGKNESWERWLVDRLSAHRNFSAAVVSSVQDIFDLSRAVRRFLGMIA